MDERDKAISGIFRESKSGETKEDTIKREIFEVLTYQLSKTRNIHLNLESLRNILLVKFNKKSMMYPHHAKQIIKAWLDFAESYNYGKFDVITLNFIIDINNPEISKFMKDNKLVMTS